MQVRLGWSKEVGTNDWQRVDVELEEVDFTSLLADVGLELPHGGTEISTGLKFLLMKVEAERLILAHQYDVDPGSAEQLKAELSSLIGKRNDLVNKVKSRYLKESSGD